MYNILNKPRSLPMRSALFIEEALTQLVTLSLAHLASCLAPLSYLDIFHLLIRFL